MNTSQNQSRYLNLYIRLSSNDTKKQCVCAMISRGCNSTYFYSPLCTHPFPTSDVRYTNLCNIFSLTRFLELSGQSKICNFAHHILINQYVSCGKILWNNTSYNIGLISTMCVLLESVRIRFTKGITENDWGRSTYIKTRAKWLCTCSCIYYLVSMYVVSYWFSLVLHKR